MLISQQKTVLLTGGSGVFGEALLNALLPNYQVICLVHKHPVRITGVKNIYGNICAPLLGMSPNNYAALLTSVDWVIHSAAITRFDIDNETILRVNYDGTRNIIEFARRAAAPLYHISTAFASPCQYHPGVLAETSYERTKRDAENLVRDAHIRAAIFRPSIVIGESDTGYTPSFQGFHMMLALAVSAVLPIVPCPENAFVDFISRDIAAQAVVAALQREITEGEYNLCSGVNALIMTELLDSIEHYGKLQNKFFARPKSIAPDIFERLIKPAFFPGLHEELRAVLLRASLMCRYASLKSPLVSSLPELLPDLSYNTGVAAKHLERSLEFMVPKLPAFLRMLKVPSTSKSSSTSNVLPPASASMPSSQLERNTVNANQALDAEELA